MAWDSMGIYGTSKVFADVPVAAGGIFPGCSTAYEPSSILLRHL
jgi:hypothetical protein